MGGRLYDKRAWRRQSRAFLQCNPLCCMCEQVGKVTLATLVDHIKPHGGDPGLFWDQENNWQSLCGTCHSGAKASFERTGKVRGCDVHGVPLDPVHPWNQ